MVEQDYDGSRGTSYGGLVSEQNYFKLNPLLDREPVGFLEDMSMQACSRAHSTEFLSDFGCAVEYAIAVVESGDDESMDHCFSSREGE